MSSHTDDRRCDEVRTALSARADGEDAPLPISEVDGHVRGCDGCTRFAADLTLLDERVAAFRRAPVPDRTATILAAAGAERRAATSGASLEQLRWLLGLAAVVQVVLAVTTLLGMNGDHALRDLAALELAAGIGLGAATWRPQFAAGLLPVVAVAALFGVATIVGDTVTGTASLATELAHVVLAVACWPLVALARGQAPTGIVAGR